MGIYCEFINLIIPIEKIDLVYPGGFLKFKEEHSQEFNGRMWHNKKLFRDGAMNYRDIEYLTEEWDARGLKGYVEANGKKKWIDYCIIGGFANNKSLQCDWLVYNHEKKTVSLKETFNNN